MKPSIIIIFLILSLAVQVIPQNKHHDSIKIDKDFYSFWLLEKYYNGLKEGKTPTMFELEGALIKDLCLPKDSSTVWISSLWKAATVNYVSVSSTEILIPDAIGITGTMALRLIEDKGNKYLQLTDSGKTYKFISLQQKYCSVDGLEKYMRDKFFTGEYYINNLKDSIVTFQTDGKMDGIQKFSKFDIMIAAADVPPKINIVMLRELGRQGYSKPFQWVNEGNKLILNEVIEKGEYREFDKIGDRFVTLTKIK